MLRAMGLLTLRLVRVRPRYGFQCVGTPEVPSAVLKFPGALQVLWLDQADAQAMAEGEEVTLMDWGNAIIRARPLPTA